MKAFTHDSDSKHLCFKHKIELFLWNLFNSSCQKCLLCAKNFRSLVPPDCHFQKEKYRFFENLNWNFFHDTRILHHSPIRSHQKNSKGGGEGMGVIIGRYGSVYTSSSGWAWLIAIINGDIMVTGTNKDTACKSFRKLYRWGAQAGYTSFLFLQESMSFYGLEVPKVFYYCDNKGLVIKINQKE